MAQSYWSREKTKELIEMLQASPELWDITCKMYKDRGKKNSATTKMAEHFGVSAAEITRKLHNLRTQMNNEIRKIKKKKSGDGVNDVVFTSNWEFFESLKFLIGGLLCTKSQTSLDLAEESGDLHTDTENSKNEFAASEEVRISDDTHTNTPSTSRPATQVVRKKKKIAQEDEVLNKAILEMTKPHDDNDIFGDFVASSLRTLQYEVNKKRLRRIIQQAILDIQAEDDSFSQYGTWPNSQSAHNSNSSCSNVSFPNSQSVHESNSSCSTMNHSLQEISRSNSATSYYENFDPQFELENTCN